MSIFFLRHSKLDLPYKNHSEMPIQVLASIASNKIDPSIDIKFTKKNFKKIKNELRDTSIIVTSQSKRAIETGDFFKKNLKEGSKIKIFTDNNLREVKFNIKNITKNYNYVPDLPQLNNIILKTISNNTEGTEYADFVLNRIKRVVKKYNNDDKTILFITHGFVIETLESYFRRKKDSNVKFSYNKLIKSRKVNYISGIVVDNNLKFEKFISIE